MKFLWGIFVCVVLLLSFPFVLNTTEYRVLSIASAQGSCDMCGYCGGDTKPGDYESCIACLYTDPGPPPTTVKTGVSWTVLGCIPTDPGSFTQTILQVVTGIIGGIMFLVFLFGGFKLLTSAGDPQQLAVGRRLVTSSIVALLLILFSLVILRFVGVEILKLSGFE